MIAPTPLTGINVHDGKNINFAELICKGLKTIETRNTNSLKPYVNHRVRIIRTGVKGSKAMIIGECTIGEPIIYNSETEFENDCTKHLVTKDSGFWIKENGIKFGYPIVNPIIYNNPYPAIGLGIISRLNQPAPQEPL
jgi:hypothetical protein